MYDTYNIYKMIYDIDLQKRLWQTDDEKLPAAVRCTLGCDALGNSNSEAIAFR